jgi:hypothetical protein
MTLERKIQLIELGEDHLGMGRNQLTARSIEGRGGRISRLGFGGEEDKREERRSWWESRSTNGKSSEPNTRLAGKVQRKQGRQARLTLRQQQAPASLSQYGGHRGASASWPSTSAASLELAHRASGCGSRTLLACGRRSVQGTFRAAAPGTPVIGPPRA